MNKITHLGVALAIAGLAGLAHGGPVQADYLTSNDNLAVLDAAQGLTWLDLSVSKGWSTSTWAGNVVGTGWRLATNAEVENLLIDAFPNFTTPDQVSSASASTAAHLADVAGFFSLFGSTWPSGDRSYGYYLTEDNVYRMAGVDYFGTSGTLWGGELGAYGLGAAAGDPQIGLYIVRAASVPEPASLALVGLALAGLGWQRRRAG